MKRVAYWLSALAIVGVGTAFVMEHPLTAFGNTTHTPSGIAKVEYQLSGATNQDWTTINTAAVTSTSGWDLVLTNPGVTHMLVAATDRAGNVAMEVQAFHVGEMGTSEPSPMKNVRYQLSGATTKTWSDYTAPFTLTNEGVTLIHISAEDMAGNAVTLTREVKIDKSAPINNGVTITLQ